MLLSKLSLKSLRIIMTKYLVNQQQFNQFVSSDIEITVTSVGGILKEDRQCRFLEASSKEKTVVQFIGYDPFTHDWVEGVSLELYQY